MAPRPQIEPLSYPTNDRSAMCRTGLAKTRARAEDHHSQGAFELEIDT